MKKLLAITLIGLLGLGTWFFWPQKQQPVIEPRPLRLGDISTGLIGHWKFDDGSGTSAADSAGSNTGTLSGSTIPVWTTPAQIGTYDLDFQGTSGTNASYVNLGNSSTLQPAAVTVAAWVKLDNFWGYNGIVGAFNSGSFYQEFYVTSSGKLAIYLNNTGSGSIFYDGSGSQSFSTGSWHHIAYTYDSTNGLTGYIDSVQDKNVPPVSGAINWAGNLSETWIGGDPANSARYVDGQIDDVRIYNRALTQSDINELYAFTGAGGGTPPPAPNKDDAQWFELFNFDHAPAKLEKRFTLHYQTDQLHA